MIRRKLSVTTQPPLQIPVPGQPGSLGGPISPNATTPALDPAEAMVDVPVGSTRPPSIVDDKAGPELVLPRPNAQAVASVESEPTPAQKGVHAGFFSQLGQSIMAAVAALWGVLRALMPFGAKASAEPQPEPASAPQAGPSPVEPEPASAPQAGPIPAEPEPVSAPQAGPTPAEPEPVSPEAEAQSAAIAEPVASAQKLEPASPAPEPPLASSPSTAGSSSPVSPSPTIAPQSPLYGISLYTPGAVPLQGPQSALKGTVSLPGETYQIADALGLTPQIDRRLAPVAKLGLVAGLRITVFEGDKFNLVSGIGNVPMPPAGLDNPGDRVLLAAVVILGMVVGLRLAARWVDRHPLITLTILAVAYTSYQRFEPVASSPAQAPAQVPGADTRLHLRLQGSEGITVQHQAIWGGLLSANIRALTLRPDRSVVVEGRARLLGIPLGLSWLCDRASALNIGPLSRLPALMPMLTVSDANTLVAEGNGWRSELLPDSFVALTRNAVAGSEALQLKGAIKLQQDAMLLDVKPSITLTRAVDGTPTLRVELDGRIKGPGTQALLLALGEGGLATDVAQRLQADGAHVQYRQESKLDDLLQHLADVERAPH